MLNIFKPINISDNKLYQEYKSELNERSILAWYPSSGNDYRDLIELTLNSGQNGIKSDSPDIFIHSDYDYKNLEFNNPSLYENEHGSVILNNKIDLVLDDAPAVHMNDGFDWTRDVELIRYSFNDKHIYFPEKAAPDLKVSLLDVDIIPANGDSVINKKVLYFFNENIGLLKTVLVPLKGAGLLNLNYLIKVREGLGLGGGGMDAGNISCAYYFLKYFGIKYLLTDPQKNTLPEELYTEMVNHIIDEADRNLINQERLLFKLNELNTIENWSDFKVKIFEVIDDTNEVDIAELRAQLYF